MNVKARTLQDTFRVDTPCRVEVEVTADESLQAGDTVEFQFPNSWSLFFGPSFPRVLQATDPAAQHYVAVQGEIPGLVFDISIRERQLNLHSHPSRHGRHIVASLRRGEVPAGTPLRILYDNTFSPYIAEEEEVWIRVNGYAPPDPPRLVVTPGPHESLRILAPSLGRPGIPFDVLVVSLDSFDNASAATFEDAALLRDDDGTTVASGLTFAGSVRVPVTLDRPGVVRFRMGDTVSNAVKVDDTADGPYWGDIHIHTKLSGDAQGSDPYGYARNVSGLDFAGVADHVDSLGPEGYRILEEWAESAYEPGRFVTILADERNPAILGGHHNLYFRDLDTFRRHRCLGDDDPDSAEYNLSVFPPETTMLLPHHTGISWRQYTEGGPGSYVPWDAAEDHGLRPAMEIYSHHGQSESFQPQHALAYEFNRMRTRERRTNVTTPGPYYAQDYWMAGQRLGIIGSSDQHTGQGGRPHGGIAAVFTRELTREGIFDAIRQRRTYATTGERILLEFDAGNASMGRILRKPAGTTIPVRVRVWGTAPLIRVELLRFRFGRDTAFHPFLSVHPEGMNAEIAVDEVVTGSCMYYARVVQEPVEWPDMAWTTPVWVDVED